MSLWSTVIISLVGGGLASSPAPEAGGALLATGSTVGPAARFFYGGRAGRGFAGIGCRLLFSGFMVGGFVAAWGQSEGGGDTIGPEAMMLLGTAGMIGSASYDIAVVGKRVRERNASRTVTLAPWRSPEGAPGLALRTTF